METYVKLDPIEHVLNRPDTYCGSVHPRRVAEYVYTDGTLKKEEVFYSPAMLRCFIEILSNATDNKTRDTDELKQTKITVTIADGVITVANDGAVIPIEINKKEKVYNHTLIFGNLLTGSNYDDTQKRTTVGRNGIGAKLANIFSKWFTVEGVDHERHLKLVQTWTRNMRKTKGPDVTKSRLKGYTKVSFELDLDRFGVSELPVDLFSRFVLDSAMLTGLRITLNGEKMPTKLDSYLAMINPCLPVCKVCDGIWVTPNDGFEHVSFVNGIRTKDGGKHVEAAVENVCRPIVEKLKTSLREVKSVLRFLVVATVINPEFNGQEKNCLESPSVKYPPISPATVTRILKMANSNGETLSSVLKSEQDKKILVKSRKRKPPTVEGYDKANYSGTSKSKDCILIVCEGLSAKTFAVAGIEKGIYDKKGRNYFGIYPLRGKLLNTRNASATAIVKNAVIMNLINILGLDLSKPSNFSKLAYGKLCMLTDADVDGIHIEGLVLNFLHSRFPKLLDVGFAISMKTPIFKLGHTFYYDERSLNNVSNKKIKYYKGLGTMKPEDVKMVFGTKVLEFETDDTTDASFSIAFDSSNTAERKKWIEKYDPNRNRETLDDTKESVVKFSVTKHLNEELVKFFFNDCARTLPSVFDGLKTSQRKILFTAKSKKITSDIKVAQFGASVAQFTEYHHGEVNLFETIVKMAQSFTGSNNVPLFSAEGMFGTRLCGGKDAAQPRYIYTKMSKMCSVLFPDSDVYEERIVEGYSIEPRYYVPILPTLLINGCVGIASGWMCSCPLFNPKEVVENAKRAVAGEPLEPLVPWYEGFTGDIVPVGSGKYETKGKYTVDTRGNKKHVIVNELPIGTWNKDFQTACELDPEIEDVRNMSTPYSPHYTLVVAENFDVKGFEKKMLTTTLNTNNIVVFDRDDKIVRVSVDDIFTMWASERLKLNADRKNRLLSEMTTTATNMEEKIKFIQLVRNNTLVLTDSEEKLVKIMKSNGLTNVELLNMPIRQLTTEKLNDLNGKLTIVRKQMTNLENKTIQQIWEEDLALFA